MARARVIITKALPFRGRLEEFSNGYTLTVDAAGFSGTDWADLIQGLVDIEKALHSGLVQFLHGSGAQQGQDIAHLRTLTGTGLAGGGGHVIHPEVCVLAQTTIARGRYLAKYFHIGRLQSAPSSGDGAGFVQVEAAFTTNLPKFTNGTLPGGAMVCAPDGTVPASPFQVDNYLRVHQFRRGAKRPPP